MKALAILKDSLLEALDTKVFYVMVVLSCLVLLFVGHISYQPVAVEDDVRRFTENLTWVMEKFGRNNNGGEMPSITLADFKQTNPDAAPWEADYRFTIVIRVPKGEQDQVDDEQRKTGARNFQQQLRQQFRHLKDLRVTAAASDDPAEVRFDVTTHGTTITKAADWPHEPTLFFALPITIWHAPLGNFVHFWEHTIVNNIGAAITLLISAVITAFFIPNMLRKGTVDLLVVKPIRRTNLLLYKYTGGLTFMFLNTTFVVVGLWLILGLRTGLWGTGFLVSIPVLTFQFAFYYAVSTLFGVLTRSAIVSILMSCFAWFVFAFVIGQGYGIVDLTRTLPEIMAEARERDPDDKDLQKEMPKKLLADWAYTTADIIHFVTPRLADLDTLTNKLIIDDTLPEKSKDRKAADKLFANFHWGEALSVTAIYIAVFLAISCWWFATKDY